ncbi:MAG: SRPBCC family protein [Parafilimonas sp.]|nr:SRPBCC family protein [Parafilimonas sp.]
MSKVYSLKAVQNIPVDLNTAWSFFSKPQNLNAITPAKLGFKIISKHHGDEMYAGQIIEYKLKPLLGIPLYWMTEITHVKPMQYFIDEQRFGPYGLWHHQHHFKQIDKGIVMTDIVHYKIPFWFIGDIANSIIVKSELKKIFEFRYKSVEENFGVWKGSSLHILFT